MNLSADHSETTTDLGLAWNHAFADLGPAFHTELRPTPLPAPHWVGTSPDVARLIGLDTSWLGSDEALQAFTGNTLLAGSRPLASVYSGHQFGVWAGQLGDGRAILLGETASGHEVQLKGAGRTLKVTADLADALFDAGYTLNVDAGVEKMPDSPRDAWVPLTKGGAGKPVAGRRYVGSLGYEL